MDAEQADIAALCVTLATTPGESGMGSTAEIFQILDEFVSAVTTRAMERGGATTHVSGLDCGFPFFPDLEITAVFGALGNQVNHRELSASCLASRRPSAIELP